MANDQLTIQQYKFSRYSIRLLPLTSIICFGMLYQLQVSLAETLLDYLFQALELILDEDPFGIGVATVTGIIYLLL